MNRRNLMRAALGGAALVALPNATTAVAETPVDPLGAWLGKKNIGTLLRNDRMGDDQQWFAITTVRGCGEDVQCGLTHLTTRIDPLFVDIGLRGNAISMTYVDEQTGRTYGYLFPSAEGQEALPQMLRTYLRDILSRLFDIVHLDEFEARYDTDAFFLDTQTSIGVGSSAN